LPTRPPWQAHVRCGFRFFRPRTPEDEQLADLLHGGAVERVADPREKRVALGAVVGEQAHLDELVRIERSVGLVQNRGGQAVVTDRHDRTQMMRTCAKLAAKRGQQRFHRSIIVNADERPSPSRCSLPSKAAQAGAWGRPGAIDMTSPLNPSGRKHRFGKAWMHEHLTDPYVREATRKGYRSRAAFKLEELAERDKLLRTGMTVVDLGAAPGSWSQVLRKKLGPKSKIVAIDLLPIEPIVGIEFVQGDFESEQGLAAIEERLGSAAVDLVLSDMSPNLSGIDVVDQARSVGLAELALDFARSHLQPGGDLVVKVFQGAGLAELQRAARADFINTYLRKPKASRDRSREHYLVGKGFRGPR
jgi:23S rRNA (uridine2552-2'-O)-methyltransferase